MPKTLEDWKTLYYEQQAQHTQARGILTQERDRAIAERDEAVTRFSEGNRDTARLDWLLNDYRRVDLYHAIGTMSNDLAECRAAIDAAMEAPK